MLLKPLAYLFAALVWLAPSIAHAQYFLGMAFEGGTPTGQFRNNANGGGGVQLEGGWANGLLPIRAGARLALYGYGIDMPQIPPGVQMMQMAPGADIDTGLSGRIWSGDLFVRLQPSHQFVEPYVEGDLGGALFEEWIEYSHLVGGAERETRSRSDFIGATYRFGLGAGLAFLFANTQEREGGAEIGVRWLLGGDTRVPGPTSITHAWPPTHSRTDMLIFSVGGTFVSF